jgi:hypothetical protein
VQKILGLIGIGSDLDRTVGSGWRLGWRRWTLTASRATAAAWGLVGESRKRDSSHDFGSGLAWEKESKQGNTFRSLEPVTFRYLEL